MVAAGPLLLSFATAIERRAVLGQDPGLSGQLVNSVVTGPGPGAAERLAKAPGMAQLAGILVLGVAGALRPDLRPGQLLLPAAVMGSDGERLTTDAGWHARMRESLASLQPETGTLLSVSTPLSEPAERRRYAAALECIAVDMETLAIARLARAHGIPWLGLRSVADPAGRPLPRAALAAFDAQGRVAAGRFVARLLLAPGEWPALWRLRQQFVAATTSLRSALRLAGAALLPPAGD